MFIVFLRVIIIYITVLIFLRLMGKRQIGEMQPYEVVITLIIADLATLPMSDTNIPLLNGILPLAILVLVHFILALITRKSTKLRRFLSGKPIIVISPKGIEYQSLKDLNMSIDDIMEMMRQNGYYSLDQVQYAIIETNGKISIISTPDNSPVTAKDLNINTTAPHLPHILIFDGQLNKDELKKSNLTIENLNTILSSQKILNIKEVVILTIDNSGKLYYQLQEQNKSIVENIYKEIQKWKYGYQCHWYFYQFYHFVFGTAFGHLKYLTNLKPKVQTSILTF